MKRCAHCVYIDKNQRCQHPTVTGNYYNRKHRRGHSTRQGLKKTDPVISGTARISEDLCGTEGKFYKEQEGLYKESLSW